jgi:putative RecB family exonuclease
MIALPMAPSERAAQLTGRESLSFSSISMYQACPQKWFFRYVVGLPEQTKSASLVFGAAIHAALQRHFDELLVTGDATPLDVLLEAYRSAWQAESDCVRFARGDSAETLELLAGRMLDAFRQSDLALPHGKILAVEEELIGDISPDCPPMLARLDLAVETDDAVVVTDFKTARSHWSAAQVEASSTQLLIYGELASRFSGDKPIRLQFGVLTKTKEPSVDVHPVCATPDRISRVRRIIERVWNAIEQEHFYPAPSFMNCSGCPYRRPCQDWSG